jgi:hypothetical protein
VPADESGFDSSFDSFSILLYDDLKKLGVNQASILPSR